MNLMEGLLHEIERNRELLSEYQSIPTGAFGAMLVAADIKDAEKALASGDTVEMLRVYNALQNNE